MKQTDIVQKGNPVLRQQAKPVAVDKIQTDTISKVIEDMKSALHDTNDGVAIAAPQIGVSLRIFIVRGDVFVTDNNPDPEDRVFINPQITNTSKEKVILDEGCLSVRNVYGKIRRSSQATIRAHNKNSEEFELGAGGLLAQIFQHETDHLNGKLFIDEASDLRQITPENTDEENFS